MIVCSGLAVLFLWLVNGAEKRIMAERAEKLTAKAQA